ncbi:hypothetical protein KK137_04400 [Croceibacterium sp. LX-88]|uniref:EpsG family protein n=1 Tax=Croceibacterium selenioxidans TaxID=2838833 RepID=A0ABS5W1C5_9SPHN|nr:hypothetical protein [Croceibacterium selenioxidans]MBT2133570.1 hypothetical protein [Croceibacterium selenioxidans]
MTASLNATKARTNEVPISKNWIRRAFPLVFALCYAGALAYLPVDAFTDRDNYFVYANYSDLILARYTNIGLISFLANEPLWLLLNIILSQYIYPENVLRVFIFVPAFVISWQLLKRNPGHAIWMVLFLISPQVVKNHIIHLRQGLALGVFVLGYFAGPKWLRICLMFASGFIHSSFFFILVIGVAVWASDTLRSEPRLRAAVLIMCFVTIGVLIGVVSGGLGARQALLYADADLEISGLGFLFWLTMFVLFASAGSTFLKDNMFAFSNLAFYLAIYFLTPVAGRIFESGLFLVFQAGLALPGWRKRCFLAAFAVLTAAQYAARVGEPLLGWGIL